MMLGLKIVPHTLARDRHTEFRVTRWSEKKKRRKNWRVVRIEIDRPGCFLAGDTLYMHPDLIAKLPRDGMTPNTQTTGPQGPVRR